MTGEQPGVRPGGEEGPTTPFLLSHHRPAEYDRCFRVGRWHLCARCLGVYPVLFALLAAQIVARAGLSWRVDPVLAFLLPVPALLDWARGRFDPDRGTNAMRLLTGVLLGGSLARTIFLHLRQPFHPLALGQFVVFAVVVVVVEARVRWVR